METKRGLLPVGFRFKPTDEEIIIHYLLKKVIDSHFTSLAISEADLNKCEPWDLPDKAAKMGEEKEWYFFCQRDRKYSTGTRTNRATESGYWKATGKDREIFCKSSNKNNSNNEGSSVVGMKKTLVFYKGRAPNGEKTNWVMHEYRLIIDEGKNNYFSTTYYNLLFSKTDDKDRWVVCRVIQKKDVGMSRRSQTSSSIKLARIDSFVNHLLDNDDRYDGATLKLPPPPLTDFFSNSCHDYGVEREFIDDHNIPSSSTSLSYYNDLEPEIFVPQYHDELKPNALLLPRNTHQIDSTVCVHPHRQSPSMFEYNKQYFPFMNAHIQRNLGFVPPSNNIPMQSDNMSVIGHSQQEQWSQRKLNRNATNCEISYVENKKTLLLDEGLDGVSFSPNISELVDSLWSS